MDIQALHQFVVGAYQGDAIYNFAEILQRWLKAQGWESAIYAENIQAELADRVLPYHTYRPARDQEMALVHYSIGSPMLDYLLTQTLQFIVFYYNLTPAHFMASLNTPHSHLLQAGMERLPLFSQRTLVALANSEWSRQDLARAGFGLTGILPVPFDEEAYRQLPNQNVLARFADDFTNLLFVGRLAPNKCIEDVLKVFYYYRQINQRSRLFLVGTPVSPSCPYHTWLVDMVAHMKLTEVYFTGHVPLTELLAYYKLADVYVSMSEHEGYGVPLMESMYFDVPVLAYQAAAVPETLGQSGVQVAHKDFVLMAELIHQLITNGALREGIIKQQRQRLEQVSMEKTHRLFDTYLNLALSKVVDAPKEL
jgi:glycosyltransferase involved in cell wall biosynthesis